MTPSSVDRRAIVTLFVFLIAFTGVALAHEGATGVVKERMDLMKGQAKQMKLIGDMAKGKKKFDVSNFSAVASSFLTLRVAGCPAGTWISAGVKRWSLMSRRWRSRRLPGGWQVAMRRLRQLSQGRLTA
jgi:hypothetical protein